MPNLSASETVKVPGAFKTLMIVTAVAGAVVLIDISMVLSREASAVVDLSRLAATLAIAGWNALPFITVILVTSAAFRKTSASDRFQARGQAIGAAMPVLGIAALVVVCEMQRAIRIETRSGVDAMAYLFLPFFELALLTVCYYVGGWIAQALHHRP